MWCLTRQARIPTLSTNRKYRPLSECSRLVGSLMKIEKHRVYAAPEKRDDVTAFCNEHWKQTAVGEGRG